MKKVPMPRRQLPKILPLILCAALLLSFTGCANADASQVSSQAISTASAKKDGSWLPKLQVEQFSENGAVILFQDIPELKDGLILYGNDYFLEVYQDNQWIALPTSQDKVNWVTNAFVVSAVPRDDVDWQWLYGSLPSGIYRIGKPLTLQKNGETVATEIVYGEFVLKVTPEETGPVYNAANDTFHSYVPLEDLPDTYSFEDAAADHVVTIIDGEAAGNQAVWHTFARLTGSGETGSVRCMVRDTATGTQTVYDVSFDGMFYNVRWLSNGKETVVTFKHMLHFQPDPVHNPHTAERFVLTMDKDVTWEDIQWGMVSDNENDAIAHKVVYAERKFNPAHAPIPECVSADLSLRGNSLISISAEAARALGVAMTEGQAIPMPANFTYLGVDLILRGMDGSEITLWLDKSGSCFLYDGIFYRCDQAAIFRYLGISQWPQEILDIYN
ncbi:MAG: hypothetical protein J6V25_12555 [Oscillospiraceae bacterium]|nr:hypothetical protein [Oscillospiraceae bacterium]